MVRLPPLSRLVSCTPLTTLRPAEDWPKQLAQLLPSSRPYLDAVIDSAGGPLVAQLTRLLKDGAVVACYGQTSGKPIELTMPAVLKNVELKGTCPLFSASSDPSRRLCLIRRVTVHTGSTMGSRDECWQAIRFIGEHQIKPVVDTALSGLDQAEEGFQLLKRGGQFGKVCKCKVLQRWKMA